MTGSIDKLSANLMLIVPHHQCSTCYNATIFHVSRSYLAHSLVSQSIIQCYALQPTMFLLHLSYLAIESKWFHVPYLYLTQLISLLWSWNPSNSWPSDCMWWHRSRSKLAKVMACCYQHQAIIRTNVYLSSIRSSGVHLMAKFKGMPKISFTKTCLKVLYLELLPHLSGENELIVAKHLKVTGYYTPTSMKLKGGYTGFTLSICLSVRLWRE